MSSKFSTCNLRLRVWFATPYPTLALTSHPVHGLCSSCAQINIPDADLDLVSRQLCGRAPIDGVEPAIAESAGPTLSMVMYREAQKVILFAETSFLVDYAEHESRPQ